MINDLGISVEIVFFPTCTDNICNILILPAVLQACMMEVYVMTSGIQPVFFIVVNIDSASSIRPCNMDRKKIY